MLRLPGSQIAQPRRAPRTLNGSVSGSPMVGRFRAKTRAESPRVNPEPHANHRLELIDR